MTDLGPSEMRIAYWNHKIVVFKFTQRMGKFIIYHGYYQDECAIGQLSKNARNALRDNGVINHKDKLIK
jgi:hypothetical protein